MGAVPNSAAWTENGVTWANQPSTTGAAANATSTGAAGFMEWTVTSQVQSMYSGSNHGFKVRDATEDAAAGPMRSFRSREAGSTPPELVVTFG
ncbi:MAG: DNRLRE domain-containing protein [Actinomycetota bacterium]|nr:DNRLRE domain-containing protein [Actinomycetota bacterium]